jgi:MoCo/4Fe-4S cofactor protein with predicted Tat translocation signal
MGMNTKYWSSLDELQQTAAAQEAMSTEFAREQSVENFLADDKLKETNTGRRDFLKFMGFSLAAATLAACETPVVKSIPYVVKPEEITPGIANYYASTYYDGNDYGSVLVKTREGRPIFIKGNKEFGLDGGAINARVNASVLGLYDGARLKGPRKNNSSDIDWNTLDAEVKAALVSASSVRILSNTVISPSAKRAIAEFSNKYAGKVRHVQYDTVSYAGLNKANNGVTPNYDFSKAKTIVSIGADFLGTWLFSSAYAASYMERRKPEGEWMNKHYQFEANMSMTGSNADVRVPIKPSQEGKVAAALYSAVTGSSPVSVEGADKAITSAAADLKKSRGASIVVSSSNDVYVQSVVAAINEALGNHGATIDNTKGTNFFQGKDEEVRALVDEMNAGSVDVLIIYGTNPVYSYPEADKFLAGLQKVKTSVNFSLFADETSSRSTYSAPDHHYLESWNDFAPVKGRIDLAQPTISPLYNTRYAQESFLRWADNNAEYYDYIRQTHNSAYTSVALKTDAQWNMAVHNGTFASTVTETATAEATATVAAISVSEALSKATAAKSGEWELEVYQKVTMGTGNQANNALLQETPDPITKTTWDNYFTMSPADMKEKGLQTYIGQCDCADVITVTVNGKSLTLPVFPTPGQKRGTIGVALGYGRGAGNEEIGNAAYQTGKEGVHLMDGDKRQTVGKNAYPFMSFVDGTWSFNSSNVSLEITGENYSIATTQMHSTVMGRESVVKETDLATFLKSKDKKRGEAEFNLIPALAVHEDVNGDGEINAQDKKTVDNFNMWREHPVEGPGHRWGLAIDLNSCIGCASCITACHIENNVPVVGKDEVLRHRDMHWLRIDRYFSSEFETLEETKEQTGKGTIGAYRHMEDPAENPKTVHMPMMCQHCNHAPCETVCPVAATVHSNEGLNNMAYNRCIGTRYCANNCPYKVRRFNWFNYVTNDKFSMVNPAQDDTLRMVLNPDVTVRTRGVMEKCSMCQQRIQEGKLEAKKAGLPLADGAIQTACAEACPVGCIVFGDLNDINSMVNKKSQSVRAYHSLEEIGVKPNVYYMTKVRNIEPAEA